jgi:hypothetical protein
MTHDWKDLTQEWATPHGRYCTKCRKRQFHINMHNGRGGRSRFVWRPKVGLCTGKPNHEKKET